jgi:CHASE3 domain sensor protein
MPDATGPTTEHEYLRRAAALAARLEHAHSEVVQLLTDLRTLPADDPEYIEKRAALARTRVRLELEIAELTSPTGRLERSGRHAPTY